MTEQVPFCSPLACGYQDAFVLLVSLALHGDKATGLSLQAAPALLPSTAAGENPIFPSPGERGRGWLLHPLSPPVSTALRPCQQNHREESPGIRGALSHSYNVPLGPANSQSALFIDAPNDSGETKQRSQRAKPICVRICLSFSFSISSCQSLSLNAPDP